MTTQPPDYAENRIQRLEAAAFVAGTDLTEIKAKIGELPHFIRAEILEYTEPVFGEIMAGRATLATRQDLDALEQRLGGKIEALDGKLDQVLDLLRQR